MANGEKEFLTLEQQLNAPAEPVKVYMVSWNARTGEYSKDIKRVAKAFLREDDAEEYKKLLLRAKQLLQDTDDIDIQIETQS